MSPLPCLLCLALTLAAVLVITPAHAQDDGTEWTGSPGFVAAVEEDLSLAATIDVSTPPKTCRPEVISKIDFGVATAAYQVGARRSRGQQSRVVNCRQNRQQQQHPPATASQTAAVTSSPSLPCHTHTNIDNDRSRVRSTGQARARRYGTPLSRCRARSGAMHLGTQQMTSSTDTRRTLPS